MDSDSPRKILNRATSQLDRRLEAPDPARVQVDGRTLAQLLAFSAEYGGLINFYDLSDNPDGDWTIFFATDPSIALALIASLDLDSIAADFQRGLRKLREIESTDRRLEELRGIVAAVLRLVRVLDTGYVAAGAGGVGLSKAIRWEVDSRLSTPLQRFAIQAAASAAEHGLRLDLVGLSPLWRLDLAAPEGPFDDVARSRDWIEQIVMALEDLIAALLPSLQTLSAQAVAQFDASLEAEGHPPQAALYVAFAILFREAQQSINSFPSRLVDFYYGTILRQDSRAALADQLYLTFTPAKDVAEASVPKDTHFPAGVDAEGAAIDYAAERSLAVYPSSVAALRNQRVTSEPLMIDGARATISRISALARVLSGIVALADQAPAIASPFPPFGDTVPRTEGVVTTSLASLGFAIASPTLMLTGGTRTVHLLLTVGAASLEKMMPKLEAIAREAGNIMPFDALAQILKKGFVLSYSTAGGWMPVECYCVDPPDPNTESTVFDLHFQLKTGAEPFVALATEPPSKAATPPPPGSAVPSTTDPVLMAALVQARVPVGTGADTVTVYPYAVLSELALAALSVTVAVDGFADLQLSSPNGPIDPTKPFALFGSPAVQGGNIEIAAPELFAKRLNSLSLSLGWYSLPQTSTGFEGYYQGYVVNLDGSALTPPIDNTSFQVTLAVDNPGLWDFPKPADPPAITYLFQTTRGVAIPVSNVPVCNTTDFLKLPVVTHSPPAYYDAALSNVQLVLSQPPYAFGDTLYARNVMAAALRETSLAAACAEKCGKTTPKPGPHLAPVLDALAAANADAPDATYRDAIAAALDKAVSQMTGAALKAVNDALAASATDSGSGESARLRASLGAALTAVPPSGGGLLARLSSRFDGSRIDAVDVASNLARWIDDNAAAFGTAAGADLDLTYKILTAVEQIAAAAAKAIAAPPAAVRPQLSAALLGAQASLAEGDGDDVQKCIQDCMGDNPTANYPNAPWLPMAASLTLSYGAASWLPSGGSGVAVQYFYLLAFDQLAAVDWPATGEVPLLSPPPDQGSLFIGLSGAPENPTLLFQMTPGPGGWSASDTVAWYQQTASGWSRLSAPDTLQGDGTNGLQNSGIATLLLQAPVANDLLWLRLSVVADADNYPLLAGLTTNAVTAAWVGPGGAATLGTPLPAGTITSSDPVLADIATIDQPLPSFGGRPYAEGPPFQMWMAERLRHKNRGIQDWDYARLILAEDPSLWQVAVLPAVDAANRPAPGHVKLVVVPGPTTLNVTDTTVPQADPDLLAEITQMLKAEISYFVTPKVVNPPYVRIVVSANVIFSDADTIAAWIARLDGELIAWLSPWPPEGLGPRPADYYSIFAIAEFIRRRTYVLGIMSIDLHYDPPGAVDDWCYLTSALKHDLKGTQPDTP